MGKGSKGLRLIKDGFFYASLQNWERHLLAPRKLIELTVLRFDSGFPQFLLSLNLITQVTFYALEEKQFDNTQSRNYFWMEVDKIKSDQKWFENSACDLSGTEI